MPFVWEFLAGGFVGGGEQGLEVFQGELGVDADAALGEVDQGVDDVAVVETVLQLVLGLGEYVGEEIVEGPFAQAAAEFGGLEDVLELTHLGSDLGDIAGGLVELAELAAEVAHGLGGGFETLVDHLLRLLVEFLAAAEAFVDVGVEVLEGGGKLFGYLSQAGVLLGRHLTDLRLQERQGRIRLVVSAAAQEYERGRDYCKQNRGQEGQEPWICLGEQHGRIVVKQTDSVESVCLKARGMRHEARVSPKT